MSQVLLFICRAISPTKRPEVRWAIYFAPDAHRALWQFGSTCLGRDAVTSAELVQPALPDYTPESLRELTNAARRYGFHATLKAPFPLARDRSEADLHAACIAFAQSRPPLNLGRLEVRALGDFLALQPVTPPAALRAWVFDCVCYFDPFRLSSSERQLTRRSQGLTARQQSLLRAWGYPYVDEEFRFHMTLTDRMDKAMRDDLAEQLARLYAPLAKEDVWLDALCLFVEPAPGASFRLVQRFTLAHA